MQQELTIMCACNDTRGIFNSCTTENSDLDRGAEVVQALAESDCAQDLPWQEEDMPRATRVTYSSVKESGVMF